MILPNADRVFIDIAKLRDYSLSTTHPEGKHKARVFHAALRLTLEDAEWLRGELIRVANTLPCEKGLQSGYGQRYTVDFETARHGLTATLRSAWIVRLGEQFPRLVSCYVL